MGKLINFTLKQQCIFLVEGKLQNIFTALQCFSDLNIKNKHMKCKLVDLCNAEGALSFQLSWPVLHTNVF